MPTQEDPLALIEAMLVTAGEAPSRFGRRVCGDPRLVFDLRRGRQPGPGMIRRIHCALGRAAGHPASREAGQC